MDKVNCKAKVIEILNDMKEFEKKLSEIIGFRKDVQADDYLLLRENDLIEYYLEIFPECNVNGVISISAFVDVINHVLKDKK